MVGRHCRMKAHASPAPILHYAVRAPRGARDRGALARAAQRRRHPAPLPGLRDEPALRRPAAARDRARAGFGPAAAAARRADGGHEPAGVRGAARADGQAARRARHRAPPDRARHEGGHERLGPHHGARRRREDRRRHAAGGAARTRASSRPTWGARHERGNGNGAMPVLEVEDIHTFYGAIEALKGVSLTVNEGEIVTLIGSNGAGKSTTLRSISGLTPPKTGAIKFRGQRDPRLLGYQVAELGIAQSPEGRRIFSRMTVLENLEMGAFTRSDRRDRATTSSASTSSSRASRSARSRRRDDVRRRAADARHRPRADGQPEAAAARRAVAGPRPGDRRQDLRDHPRDQPARRRRSCSSSRTPTTRSTSSHRGYVLETGRVVLANDSASLRDDPEVQNAYLGA